MPLIPKIDWGTPANIATGVPSLPDSGFPGVDFSVSYQERSVSVTVEFESPSESFKEGVAIGSAISVAMTTTAALTGAIPFVNRVSRVAQIVSLVAPPVLGAEGFIMGLTTNALARALNIENGFKVTISLDKPPTFEALPDDLPNDYPNPGGPPGTPDKFPNTPPPGTPGTPVTSPAKNDVIVNEQTNTLDPSTINTNKGDSGSSNGGGGRDETPETTEPAEPAETTEPAEPAETTEPAETAGTGGTSGGDRWGGETTGPHPPPVVLDLDGDGVELLDLTESNALFDWQGDGFRRLTSWVAADDALLAYDKNSDGVIRDADEISFVSYLEGATTDLEGLKAFDSNNDNLLNADDEEWSKFGAWQDLNGDGFQDEGEFSSLEERGIIEINLVSDNNPYLDGTSLVYGKTTYTTSDHTRFAAADVAFLALPLGIKRSTASKTSTTCCWATTTSYALSEKATSHLPMLLLSL